MPSTVPAAPPRRPFTRWSSHLETFLAEAQEADAMGWGVPAWVERDTIPHLPVRQWVLSVPKRLRPFLHQTPEVASAVLALFLRALRSTLEEASPDAPQGSRLGAISFPQRFGSSLNPHRAGLERLVRYCARGPLALERLHAPAGIGALTSPEARLVYRLPEPDVHGRQALRLTPLELLKRLARLVPPPDQRFASVPSIDTATTGSWLPTHA